MMRRQAQHRGWTGVVLLMMLVSGLLNARAGEAATYYVATSGSSGCSTNINAPSGNVQNILNCLGPGDTLYFRKGTYNIGPLTNPPGGNSSNRVTIAGYPQDGALAVRLNVGDGSSNGANLGSADSSYITWDNLIFDAANAGYVAFKITGSAHHIRIANSEIRNAPASCILANAGQEGTQGFNEYLNLKVHDCGSSQLDHGFYLASSDSLIEGCDIYNNYGNGIQVYNGSNDNASRNVIRKNRIHNNNHSSATTGIVLDTGDDNVAYNNLIYNGGGGIQVRNGGSGNKVYNNTIFNNSGGDSGGACLLNLNSGTTMRNNICFQNQTNAISGDGNTSTSNNLFSDPRFVNASGLDFHLQAGSPAINAGFDLSNVVTTDYEGAPRPQGGGFDIGAYEFGKGGEPLLAPRNLRMISTK